MTGTDKAIRYSTIAAVAAVGLAAAVLSYRHQFELAAGHGESALTAKLLPISIDGLRAADDHLPARAGENQCCARLLASLGMLSSMEMISDKGRENRVRQVAERRGLRLEKSRRRDPHAIGYGRYRLIDAATSTVVSLLGGAWLTLKEVENQLETLSAVQDPPAVRLIRAVAALGMAMSPLAGLDPRTMGRLAEPVTAAANLLGSGTTGELGPAVQAILTVAEAVGPPDIMKLGPLLDELRAAFSDYELSRGRLPRPIVNMPGMREFRPGGD